MVTQKYVCTNEKKKVLSEKKKDSSVLAGRKIGLFLEKNSDL